MSRSPVAQRRHALVLGATFVWVALTGSRWPLLACAVVAFAQWIWSARGRWTPQGGFGLANAITGVRLALSLVVGVLPADAVVPWAGLCVALFFTLDGVDGYVAQRYGSSSEFGAAFDTETDALMVALASLVVVDAGLLGGWVLVVGGLRYAFVVDTTLHATKPEPRRRLGRWAFSALMSGLSAALIIPHTVTIAALAAGAAAVIASFLRSFFWSYGPGRVSRSATRS